MLLPRASILVSSLLATACADESPAPAPAPAAEDQAAPAGGLPDHDSALAHRLVEQQGALLLDVRTPEEFAAGHVEGAHNIPHETVAARLGEIRSLVGDRPQTPIVVYCQSGRRSGIAKEALVAGGFTQVTNLGPMSNW